MNTLEGGVSDVDWGRVIERLCFLFPPVVGIGVVGVLQEADPDVPGLESGLVLIGSFGYTLLTLGMAIAIVLDARRARANASDDSLTWPPRPWLNAVFALLWAPAAGVVYLARRHRAVGTPPGWSGWWLVVAVSLVSTVIGLAAAIVAIVLAIPGLFVSAVALAGAIAIGTFPIALHQDAAYVSARDADWNPNPGLYLGAALVSLFLAPLQPFLAAYYLYRRRRALGVP